MLLTDRTCLATLVPAGMHGQPPGPPGPPPGLQGMNGMGPGGGPMGQGMGAASNRIDPSQIPRPSASPLTSAAIQFETRMGGQHVAPPPAASRYAVRDCGSAGPRYMRSSLNQVQPGAMGGGRKAAATASEASAASSTHHCMP